MSKGNGRDQKETMKFRTLLYPLSAIIVAISLIEIGYYLSSILPQCAQLLAKHGAKFSLPLRACISVGQTVTLFWAIPLIVLFTGLLLLLYYSGAKRKEAISWREYLLVIFTLCFALLDHALYLLTLVNVLPYLATTLA